MGYVVAADGVPEDELVCACIDGAVKDCAVGVAGVKFDVACAGGAGAVSMDAECATGISPDREVADVVSGCVTASPVEDSVVVVSPPPPMISRAWQAGHFETQLQAWRGNHIFLSIWSTPCSRSLSSLSSLSLS